MVLEYSFEDNLSYYFIFLPKYPWLKDFKVASHKELKPLNYLRYTRDTILFYPSSLSIDVTDSYIRCIRSKKPKLERVKIDTFFSPESGQLDALSIVRQAFRQADYIYVWGKSEICALFVEARVLICRDITHRLTLWGIKVLDQIFSHMEKVLGLKKEADIKAVIREEIEREMSREAPKPSVYMVLPEPDGLYGIYDVTLSHRGDKLPALLMQTMVGTPDGYRTFIGVFSLEEIKRVNSLSEVLKTIAENTVIRQIDLLTRTLAEIETRIQEALSKEEKFLLYYIRGVLIENGFPPEVIRVFPKSRRVGIKQDVEFDVKYVIMKRDGRLCRKAFSPVRRKGTLYFFFKVENDHSGAYLTLSKVKFVGDFHPHVDSDGVVCLGDLVFESVNVKDMTPRVFRKKFVDKLLASMSVINYDSMYSLGEDFDFVEDLVSNDEGWEYVDRMSWDLEDRDRMSWDLEDRDRMSWDLEDSDESEEGGEDIGYTWSA